MVAELYGITGRRLWHKPGQSLFMPKDLYIKAIHIAAIRPDFANQQDVSVVPNKVDTDVGDKWGE